MTGRDFSNIDCHYCNKFGHYKNDFADFVTIRQQNQRRRQRQHKQRCGHKPKPGGSSSRGEGGKCCANTTRPPPTVKSIAAPGQQSGLTVTPTLPKSVLRVFCGVWDLPVQNDSDEKPCTSFSAREVQPATKPSKAQVKEEKGTWPFGQTRQQR